MFAMTVKKLTKSVTLALVLFTPYLAQATGGIAIQKTRIVFAAKQKQATITVENTTDANSFLMQSWVENAAGNKTKDFIVTPPLFVISPGDENILRLIYTGGVQPNDRETLYYFVNKAIPSIDKEKIAENNVLMITTAARLKLFYRPEGLSPAIQDAPAALQFQQQGNQLKISNPTPYYLTLIDLKAGGQPLKDVMVPPKDSLSQPLPAGNSQTITYSTINDYGTSTPQLSKPLK